MSIRIEINKAGAKALANETKSQVNRRGRSLTTVNTDRYGSPEVKMIDASCVQIVLATHVRGVRITMTSCDLMDLIQKTFNGTMKLVGGASELAQALQAVVNSTVAPVVDDEAESADFSQDEGEDIEDESEEE